jgi:glutathione S-transferase
VTFEGLRQPTHLARNPFGQIPTFEQDAPTLFETGAIVLHIADRHAGLLSEDPDARARAISWMFAAVNSVEPGVLEVFNAKIVERDQPWAEARLPIVIERARKPLRQLADHLGDDDWLDGTFSAGDLMMVSVLLRFRASGILDEFPTLTGYVARGEARPAYRRAFDAQLAFNTRSGS